MGVSLLSRCIYLICLLAYKCRGVLESAFLGEFLGDTGAADVRATLQNLCGGGREHACCLWRSQAGAEIARRASMLPALQGSLCACVASVLPLGMVVDLHTTLKSSHRSSS